MVSLEDIAICSRSLMACPSCGYESGEIKSTRDKYWGQCRRCNYTSYRTFDTPWEAVDDWNKAARKAMRRQAPLPVKAEAVKSDDGSKQHGRLGKYAKNKQI